MTAGGSVGVRHDGPIATVRVGSGRRANALTTSDWLALAALCDELAADRDLRAVVVSGSGDGAFSAGSDIREWLSVPPADIDSAFAAMENAFTAIERLPVPVVAAVRGTAAGAGCQLACACDLRVVAEDARLGMPIARWGILVPPAFAARLALLTGPAAARDLLFTGRLVDGPEALRLGLASTCVPEAELDDAVAALVASITAHPPAAIRAAKRSVDALLTPVRERLHTAPPGPAADYPSMQAALRTFLSRVTGTT
ncbi:enoyl-CoA hydratase/isomerase family protein [Streptomyces sp. V3I7]|uniref:enoyl-CoA hydratase/isomerase family protein n=1 Tax=Streptomyces sp. V3I7 TaxID=3042278 RepID=UPI00278B8686|nr:enoyl-CoA hydratase/isomerase family protein [Streptomyces sp. V3I7]MDQ0988911.1 enoyl-CoA hydratase [Streptomyces sp. V3I7]